MERVGLIGGIIAGVMLAAGAASADDEGRAEYVNACASCHGMEGQGDGPFVDLLKLPVPSLTGLAAANDGVFPMLDVMHVIDGRQSIRGHGNPMPVWGRQYEMQAEADDLGAYGGEAVVRGRVLSLVYYLESIQE